jgi:hypothetical protein
MTRTGANSKPMGTCRTDRTGLVNMKRGSCKPYPSHMAYSSSILKMETAVSFKILVNTYIPVYTVLHPRRQLFP